MKLMSLAAGSAAALALAGTAAAAPNREKAPASFHVATSGHVHVSVNRSRTTNGVVAGSFLSAAVTYLGVDKATLVADLKAGQSLAQVATAQGKTADGLVAALLAPAKLKLDAAVMAGKLTADRETTLLTRLQTVLTTVVEKTAAPHTGKGTHKVRVRPQVIIQAATAYLGVDLKTILQDVRGGQTLAAIAVAHGKTSDGLVAAIVASVKAKLDAQVTAGTITQAQEDSFIVQLQTSATAFVTGSHS